MGAGPADAVCVVALGLRVGNLDEGHRVCGRRAAHTAALAPRLQATRSPWPSGLGGEVRHQEGGGGVGGGQAGPAQ